MGASDQAAPLAQALERPYRHGFTTDVESDSLPPGLDEGTIRAISLRKREPEFLLKWRLAASFPRPPHQHSHNRNQPTQQHHCELLHRSLATPLSLLRWPRFSLPILHSSPRPPRISARLPLLLLRVPGSRLPCRAELNRTDKNEDATPEAPRLGN